MNLVSEILRGSWLLESSTPDGYKLVAENILSGQSFQSLDKQETYSIIHNTETTSSGKVVEKDAVAVIEMIGAMTKYDTLCNFGAVGFAEQILDAERNPEIKGIILRIDGPGGNADAITVFQSLKNKITKPVVALVDKACSLHYWVAAILSEHIMLSNDFQAECGSIGAMIMFAKPKEEIIIIRPPESQDKNQALINALEGDYKALEEKLSILSKRFMSEVKEHRPNVKDEALHGKTFLAQEAIDMGLADSIGDLQKAYDLVIAKSELSKI